MSYIGPRYTRKKCGAPLCKNRSSGAWHTGARLRSGGIAPVAPSLRREGGYREAPAAHPRRRRVSVTAVHFTGQQLRRSDWSTGSARPICGYRCQLAPPLGKSSLTKRGIATDPPSPMDAGFDALAAGPRGRPGTADAPAHACLRRRSLRGDPLVYPQQRGGDHPYVVAQATYLSANAVLFGEDAFGCNASERPAGQAQGASRPSAAPPGGSACAAATSHMRPD